MRDSARIVAGALVCLAISASVFPAAAFKQSSPSFEQALAQMSKIGDDPSATREQRLSGVRALLRMHKQTKDPSVSQKCLFHAAKASLALYRSSNCPEDLQRAEAYFREFRKAGGDTGAGTPANGRLPEGRLSGTLGGGGNGKSASFPKYSSALSGYGVAAGTALLWKIPPNPPFSKGGFRTALPSPPFERGGPGGISLHGQNKSPYLRHRALSVAEAQPGRGDDLGPWGAPASQGEGSSNASAEPDASAPVQSPVGQSPAAPEPSRNPFCPPGRTNLLEGLLPVRQVSLVPRTAIDAACLPAPRESPSPKTIVAPPAQPRSVVVIDPGHGGKDPGAVSQDGRLKEKDVALNIAERLRKILEKDEAVEVFLTRSDDRFMSLEDRAAAAASAKADLFISIHCNADLDSSSNGIETYYLSKACSRKSMKVAARENGIPLSNMNELEATIVNLEVSYRLAGSSRLAALVQKSVTDGTGKRFSSKRDRGVRRAAFSILAGAGASAVLVECGFLSNPSDQRKLETPAYLEQFAQALARAVRDYLSGNAQAK